MRVPDGSTSRKRPRRSGSTAVMTARWSALQAADFVKCTSRAPYGLWRYSAPSASRAGKVSASRSATSATPATSALSTVSMNSDTCGSQCSAPAPGNGLPSWKCEEDPPAAICPERNSLHATACARRFSGRTRTTSSVTDVIGGSSIRHARADCHAQPHPHHRCDPYGTTASCAITPRRLRSDPTMCLALLPVPALRRPPAAPGRGTTQGSGYSLRAKALTTEAT